LRNDWYAIVEEYYKQIENCGVYDPDLLWIVRRFILAEPQVTCTKCKAWVSL
jgi:hypothetical protein